MEYRNVVRCVGDRKKHAAKAVDIGRGQLQLHHACIVSGDVIEVVRRARCGSGHVVKDICRRGARVRIRRQRDLFVGDRQRGFDSHAVRLVVKRADGNDHGRVGSKEAHLHFPSAILCHQDWDDAGAATAKIPALPVIEKGRVIFIGSKDASIPSSDQSTCGGDACGTRYF